MAAMCGGCQTAEPWQVGQSGITAYCAYGSVWLDIKNPRGGTLAVVAAAEDALRGRGYVQRSRAHVEDDPVTVRARRAGAGASEATVSIREGVDATRVEVRVEPSGNGAESREIMSALLVRLGY